MRLLFAHDHRFSRGPRGEVYTAGSFPASAWDRFLGHFEEVHVIGRDGGPMAEGLQLARSDRDGVTFDFLPSLGSLRQLLMGAPEARERMLSAVESADAVVARLPSEIGLLAVKLARELGKPYAVEVAGCAWDSYRTHGAPAARLYAALAYGRARAAIARAPFALYVTDSWLQGRYPSQGRSISASNVAIRRMDKAGAGRRARRLTKLESGEPPVLGTIGTLWTKYKGLQTAIEAVARIRSSGLDLHYRILGPGPSEPWRDLARKHGVADLVHFDGTRSAGADVCGWLDEIDIYLQPSLTEGLPRGMIEAMSRGAACVGSTRGGIPELIPPERLHRAGNVAELARLVRELATDPARVAAASAADRVTARRFEDEILSKRRSDLYGALRKEAERHARQGRGR